MASPVGNAPSTRRAAIRLENLERTASAGIGLAALLVGQVCVSRGIDGIGSVALVASGSIFLAVAVLGRFPTRVTVGDHSVDLSEDVGVVDAIALSLSEKALQEAADEIFTRGREDVRLRVMGRRLVEHVTFDAAVKRLVETSAQALNAEVITEPEGQPWDMEVHRGAHRLFIDVRLLLDVASAQHIRELTSVGNFRLIVVVRELEPMAEAEITQHTALVRVIREPSITAELSPTMEGFLSAPAAAGSGSGGGGTGGGTSSIGKPQPSVQLP